MRIVSTAIFSGLMFLGFAAAGLHAADATVPSLQIQSPAFAANASIPDQYTCKGQNISPPLAWSGVPRGTETLALIVDDPDAPDPQAPKKTWVHWVLYDIPASSTGLKEAVKALPPGTQSGANDWMRPGYDGPCPPTGRHRYFFKLYALNDILVMEGMPSKAELEAAMKGHVLAQASLVGTYDKLNQ